MAEPASDLRRSTLAFLGLEIQQSGRSGRVVVTDALVNPTGTFFGGAGVAIAVAMMEVATERRTLWTTVQFVSNPPRGCELACRVDEVARGGRISQVRVTAEHDGREVFLALGATGENRGDMTQAFDHMPQVPPPEECPPATFEMVGDVSRSYFAAIDRRLAGERDGLDGTGSHLAFWTRVVGQKVSDPMLGYFGDVAALGVFSALRLPVARPVMRVTSLDNTLRVGPAIDTEWVLLDLRANAVVAGYGHGTVCLWSPDGVMLGQMSQSLALREVVDPHLA